MDRRNREPAVVETGTCCTKANSPLSFSLKHTVVKLNGCHQHPLPKQLVRTTCTNKGGTVEWLFKPLHPLAYLADWRMEV